MKLTREEIGGIIGTGIFSILLLLILIFSYFTLMSVPDELEGIPVMFGNVESASGNIEPPYNEVVAEPLVNKPQIPEYAPEPPLIAQDSEPTIDVSAKREEERKKAQQIAEERRLAQQRAEEQRRREEAERKQREEQERKSREISQQMSGLFGESAGSRGESEGSGTQGVSTGNDNKGATTGVGGIGSYNLGGRSLGRGGLAQPSYSANDYGTVVVNITVDPQGNVIQALIGQGTNTPNSSLREEARRAALRTKFNSTTSVNNQNGTITYRFNLK